MILSRYSVIVCVSLVCMVFVVYFCFSLLSICGHVCLNPKLCCIFVLSTHNDVIFLPRKNYVEVDDMDSCASFRRIHAY